MTAAHPVIRRPELSRDARAHLAVLEHVTDRLERGLDPRPAQLTAAHEALAWLDCAALFLPGALSGVLTGCVGAVRGVLPGPLTLGQEHLLWEALDITKKCLLSIGIDLEDRKPETN